MKRIYLWLPLILLPCLLGCRATSIMVGHREQDLNQVRHAQNRAQVEKVLGRPLWHPGTADGLTYEIYQFEAGRPARPAFGTIGLCLDVASFGLTESYTLNKKDFEPAKEVAVTYDTNNRVHFVSPSWPVHGTKPERRMFDNTPVDSGVPEDVQPLRMIHWIGTNEAETVLEMPWFDRWPQAGLSMVHVSVDGRKTKGSLTSLPPGSHEVTFDMDYIVFTEQIEVLPRRVYRLNIERYRYGDWTDVTWIEDVESREVLCCRQTFPPEP